MKIFWDTWQDIRRGQNFDIYITLIIALTVAVLGTLGIANPNIISSAILATLSLVALSLLISRRGNDKIQDQLQKLETLDSFKEDFLREGDYYWNEIIHLIRRAQKVFFWGYSFSTTIPLLRDEIEVGLQTGLEVRFLLVEPHSKAAEMTIFGSRHRDISEFNSSLEVNISRLSRLAQKTQPSQLEIKVVNYLPHCAVIAIDPHLPTGKMFVQIATFRIARDRYPSFQLTRSHYDKWFSLFVEQFETIWKEAKHVKDISIKHIS